jgi:hypothetical protein
MTTTGVRQASQRRIPDVLKVIWFLSKSKMPYASPKAGVLRNSANGARGLTGWLKIELTVGL